MHQSVDKATLALRAQSVVWRLQGRSLARAVVLVAVAMVASLIALVAFNVGAFVALEQHWGPVAAGVVIGAVNLAVAGTLLGLGLAGRAPTSEETMARELRDLSLTALAQDVDEARLEALKFIDDVHRIRAAVGAVTGTFVSPLTSALSVLTKLDDGRQAASVPEPTND